MQLNNGISNEDGLNQQNLQANFTSKQIQQRKNVISHQQMNFGIQSFSQQQSLPNSFQPINLFGTTKLSNIFALPCNNSNRFTTPT
ncbi:MAG: hypothetical protein ACK5NI_02775 [bacterium]